ncbi:MAG: hypothetical protein EU547_02780 [Promethearchaeota archaeon]|nr:MAG: hypothetical protein EU547_02780 [Candidatus Lokiarchaeota archaeon]
MEKFLNQLNLSQNAITIYLESLNHPFLIYSDIKTILPEINDEELIAVINHLKELDLFLEIIPENAEILTRYYTIPPINTILTYFNNIEKNFSNIQENIEKLVIRSTNQIFEEKSEISLDDVQEKTKSIFKDFEERTLLEKKDMEDISKNFEIVHKIQDEYGDLQERVVNLTKAQFGNLIKMISRLKNDIQTQIKGFEFKKENDKEAVINIIEQIFKTELDDLVETFIESITTSIKEEFEKTSFTPIIQQLLQSRNEYTMIFHDLMNNFETNFNNLSHKINEKQKGFKPHLEELKDRIIQKSNQIIQNSVKQVLDLNKPIIDVISDCRTLIYTKENLITQDIWTINSINQMKEELMYAIKNTKNELLLIVPTLKDFVSVELFKDIPNDVIVYVASSDHFVNSKVKELMSFDNVKFKQYNKTDFIGVRSDSNFIAFGIINAMNDDSLDNFIGLGTNKEEIFNSLTQTLTKIWSAAQRDSGKPSLGKQFEQPHLKKVQIPEPNEIQKKERPQNDNKVVSSVSDRVSELDKTRKRDSTELGVPKEPPAPREKQSSQISQGTKEEYISKIYPDSDNEAANIINDAFNEILEQINEFTGIQFAQQLENIADLILEKHGFSVSLHHIRRYINQFNRQEAPLSAKQKSEILENFEEWKRKLFKK